MYFICYFVHIRGDAYNMWDVCRKLPAFQQPRGNHDRRTPGPKCYKSQTGSKPFLGWFPYIMLYNHSIINIHWCPNIYIYIPFMNIMIGIWYRFPCIISQYHSYQYPYISHHFPRSRKGSNITWLSSSSKASKSFQASIFGSALWKLNATSVRTPKMHTSSGQHRGDFDASPRIHGENPMFSKADIHHYTSSYIHPFSAPMFMVHLPHFLVKDYQSMGWWLASPWFRTSPTVQWPSTVVLTKQVWCLNLYVLQ